MTYDILVVKNKKQTLNNLQSFHLGRNILLWVLTVILQASHLKSLVIGEEHPTVITFDMALYEKAVQFLDSRDDLKRTFLPRLDEVHTVMAALRALFTSIDNSRIDDAWIELDVYGFATTQQILKCAHYKRTHHAHLHMYMALYELLLDKFFTEKTNLKCICSKPVNQVLEACARSAVDRSTSPECIINANDHLLQTLTDEDVIEQLKTWEAEKCGSFWPHQRCHASQQSLKGNLVSLLIKHKNTMRYNQVLS